MKLGSGPEDKPIVNVTGYDSIPANTIVEFNLYGPLTLAFNVTTTIKIGFEFFYKDLDISNFFYEPTPFVPIATTHLAMVNADSYYSVTATGDNTVGSTSDYKFNF